LLVPDYSNELVVLQVVKHIILRASFLSTINTEACFEAAEVIANQLICIFYEILVSYYIIILFTLIHPYFSLTCLIFVQHQVQMFFFTIATGWLKTIVLMM